MELNIRSMTYEEIKYTYAQSVQLRGQSGSIGRLRGDFDSNGHNFYTTWDDHCKALKTTEFVSEFDDVINALRSDDYGLLQSRPAMRKFVKQYPDSAISGNYTLEYGFRVDTKEHSYLLRCNPTKGDYNFYCFCYVRASLDLHIENAKKGIRFIDSAYNELFHLPDDEWLRITSHNGEVKDYRCRYVDEAHVEVGGNLFHICEFAERMEQSGNTYQPKYTPLPRYCFGVLPSTGEIIKITRYERGYTPLKAQPQMDAKQHGADPLNEAIGVTKAQAKAMEAGSLFGWHCPGAKPDNYDKNGVFIKDKSENNKEKN